MNYLDITAFLERSSDLPVVDARSENEFERAHFPGSVNIPMLNNEERVVVGTTYKQKGRNEAVLSGFDLAGKRFGNMVREALKIAPRKEVIIYCWRGGMRSGILSWILNLAGFKVHVLKGGYKSFRKWVLQTLSEPKRVLVLGGLTASGKTELLRLLKAAGEQVIDLEALACHRGSAFGALGQPKQPSNEHFENLLAIEWGKPDAGKPVWLENESRTIGSNILPENIYNLIRTAPVIEIEMKEEWRVERVLNEYASFPAAELEACTKKVAKRLGGLRLKEAIEYLHTGDLISWSKIMLNYYDKMYSYGMEQRKPGTVKKIELHSHNHAENVKTIIEFVKNG